MLAALERNEIQKGDAIVIRIENAKDGPGLSMMLTPPRTMIHASLRSKFALLAIRWRRISQSASHTSAPIAISAAASV